MWSRRKSQQLAELQAVNSDDSSKDSKRCCSKDHILKSAVVQAKLQNDASS